MKNLSRILLSVLAAVLFAVSANAQFTTSSLGGKVTDENGEALAGAAVIAVHTPSGTQYYAVTNAEGRFFIGGMRAGGPYVAEVSCLGYQTQTFTDIILELADTYSLNSMLREDKQMLSEAIVVSDAVSKFSTEKTGAATNISGQQISSLPTISRSIPDITKLDSRSLFLLSSFY